MFGAGNSRRRAARLVLSLGLAILCSAALASGAVAATLGISVPGLVHKHQSYTVKVTGSFRPSQVRHAYLISLLQYSPSPCKSSAQLEYNFVNHNLLQFYLGKNGGIFINTTPFTRADGFTAVALGKRHVCAYLYSQKVGPTSGLSPIARADHAFRVVS